MTSLAIWDPSVPSGLRISSSHFSWNRQSAVSVSQRRCEERFGSRSLGWVSTSFLDRLQILQWHGVQRRSRGLREGTGVRVFCVVTEKNGSSSQVNGRSAQPVRRLILLRHAKSSSWSDRSIEVVHDIASAIPTSRSRISKIWSKMNKSWASDHERPLSRRGRQAACSIALKLQESEGWRPQLILCSDSTRTRETLEIMQQELPEFLDGDVRHLSSFYSVAAMDGKTVQHLQEIIPKCTRDDVTTVMCMGHNRGWEEAASLLSGVNVELKTANAALLETKGSSWKEAFQRAGLGGWKLVGILKPDPICVEEGAMQ